MNGKQDGKGQNGKPFPADGVVEMGLKDPD